MMDSKIGRQLVSLMLALLIGLSVSCGGSTTAGESAVAEPSDLSLLQPPSAPARRPTVPDGPVPTTVQGYINLSLQYYTEGEWEKCIEACIMALNLDPTSVIAYNNICSAYMALQDYDRAILACEKALALDPDYQRATNNLAAAQRAKARVAP